MSWDDEVHLYINMKFSIWFYLFSNTSIINVKSRLPMDHFVREKTRDYYKCKKKNTQMNIHKRNSYSNQVN